MGRLYARRGTRAVVLWAALGCTTGGCAAHTAANGDAALSHPPTLARAQTAPAATDPGEPREVIPAPPPEDYTPQDSPLLATVTKGPQGDPPPKLDPLFSEHDDRPRRWRGCVGCSGWPYYGYPRYYGYRPWGVGYYGYPYFRPGFGLGVGVGIGVGRYWGHYGWRY